jgi:hypothetical protein
VRKWSNIGKTWTFHDLIHWNVIFWVCSKRWSKFVRIKLGKTWTNRLILQKLSTLRTIQMSFLSTHFIGTVFDIIYDQLNTRINMSIILTYNICITVPSTMQPLHSFEFSHFTTTYFGPNRPSSGTPTRRNCYLHSISVIHRTENNLQRSENSKE